MLTFCVFYIANKSFKVISQCTVLWCKPSATPKVVTKVMKIFSKNLGDFK